jgi:hypothetical protein
MLIAQEQHHFARGGYRMSCAGPARMAPLIARQKAPDDCDERPSGREPSQEWHIAEYGHLSFTFFSNDWFKLSLEFKRLFEPISAQKQGAFVNFSLLRFFGHRR